MTTPGDPERVPASATGESFTGFRVPRATPEQGGIPLGALIADKYRVERVLGEGAMGIVYAARHLELDELVAIKCIRSAVPWSSDIIARFAREAKACARLKSEHVAKVIDVGVCAPVGPYMVMEYLDGKDLGAVLKERGPLPVRRAAEYVMQVCEALALAHAASITHRDVKPENLFLTRHGDLEIIKVLDFGISKAPATGRVFGGEISVKETSFLMGTPLYMSPEQIRSTREVDHRSDLWSLGVVLFELLTGRPAFAGETVTQVCALVLEASPPRLTEYCKGAPEDLASIIERCLQKDPVDRFQSAAELAHALLPFAPARARLHAERAAAVLCSRNPANGEDPLPSTLPEGGGRGSLGTAAPTVLGAGVTTRPSGRLALRAVALTSLLCAGLGFFGWRGLRSPGDGRSSGSTAAPATVAKGARPTDAPSPPERPTVAQPGAGPVAQARPTGPELGSLRSLTTARKAVPARGKPRHGTASAGVSAELENAAGDPSPGVAAPEPKAAPESETRTHKSRVRLVDDASPVRLLE